MGVGLRVWGLGVCRAIRPKILNSSRGTLQPVDAKRSQKKVWVQGFADFICEANQCKPETLGSKSKFSPESLVRHGSRTQGGAVLVLAVRGDALAVRAMPPGMGFPTPILRVAMDIILLP